MLAVRKYVESATSLLIVSNGPVVEIASSGMRFDATELDSIS